MESETIGGVDLDAMNQAINDAVRAAVEESGGVVHSVSDWSQATSVSVVVGGVLFTRYAWKNGTTEWWACDTSSTGRFPSFAESRCDYVARSTGGDE